MIGSTVFLFVILIFDLNWKIFVISIFYVNN